MIAPAVKERLQRIGVTDDADLDLGEAALAMSAAVSGAGDITTHMRHLGGLVDGVRDYMRGTEDTLDLRIEALSRMLAGHYGYGALSEENEEDDNSTAEDACLSSLIEKRHGSGLCVGLLYLRTARALGWAVEGLDFPSRFPMRLDFEGGRAIIDAQAGGLALETPDLRALLKEAAGAGAELAPTHFRPMENRAIIFRYQSDLKMRLLRSGRLEDALRAVEAMLLIAPSAATLWREAGLMHARLDNVPAAVLALEHYLSVADESEGRYKALQLLQELREKLS